MLDWERAAEQLPQEAVGPLGMLECLFVDVFILEIIIRFTVV